MSRDVVHGGRFCNFLVLLGCSGPRRGIAAASGADGTRRVVVFAELVGDMFDDEAAEEMMEHDSDE